MNQAMPDWRTFSTGPDEASAAAAADDPPRRQHAVDPRWLGIAAALVAVAVVSIVLIVAAVAALVVGTAPMGPTAGQPVRDGTGLSLDPGSLPNPMLAALDRPSTDIVVDVAGAVMQPGLHRLRAGDRVGDAVEAAGGFAPRVDLTAVAETLNLAETLEDGAKVLVPELGRPGAVAAPSDGRIDLNQADQAALESLPGIGPVTAAKIIAARQEAPFESVDELRSRGVLGASVFAEVRELVTVSR
jgi:competence protein ComEA